MENPKAASSITNIAISLSGVINAKCEGINSLLQLYKSNYSTTSSEMLSEEVSFLGPTSSPLHSDSLSSFQG